MGEEIHTQQRHQMALSSALRSVDPLCPVDPHFSPRLGRI